MIRWSSLFSNPRRQWVKLATIAFMAAGRILFLTLVPNTLLSGWASNKSGNYCYSYIFSSFLRNYNYDLTMISTFPLYVIKLIQRNKLNVRQRHRHRARVRVSIRGAFVITVTLRSMRREPRRFFAVRPYIVSFTRWSRRRTKTMRSPRSLLETIRAFRSQINSLSRLWSHPRGAAGSQGDSRWDHGGIARAKALWLPYTHTRRHACWPQLYEGSGSGLDHPRIE